MIRSGRSLKVVVWIRSRHEAREASGES